jgi:hypothetical protein
MAIIKDGAAGYTAKVNRKNQLWTHAVTLPAAQESESEGNAWMLTTSVLTITNDATIGYLKNTTDLEFIVEGIVINMGSGITYTDQPIIEVYKNPTGGDVISDALPMGLLQNRNFGFSDTFSGDVFSGKVGGTLTGGDGIMAKSIILKEGRTVLPANFILPKQASIGAKLIINGTGSASMFASISGYFLTPQ